MALVLTGTSGASNLDSTNGLQFATWTTGTRPASPVVGQMGYNTTTGNFDMYTASGWVVAVNSSTGSVPASKMPVGSIVQVVNVLNTTIYSSSSTSYVLPTNMTASITPTSATNKILVLMRITLSGSLSGTITLRGALFRDSTYVDGEDSSATPSYSFADQRFVNYLDSPATTSSVAYSYRLKGDGAAWTVNQCGFGGNGASSTLTLLEVVA